MEVAGYSLLNLSSNKYKKGTGKYEDMLKII
jgi:hypothetical protein